MKSFAEEWAEREEAARAERQNIAAAFAFNPTARALYSLHRQLDTEIAFGDLAAFIHVDLDQATVDTATDELTRRLVVLGAAFSTLIVRGEYQSAFSAQKLYLQILQYLRDRKTRKPVDRTIKRTDIVGDAIADALREAKERPSVSTGLDGEWR